MTTYELTPTDGQKSFYTKEIIKIKDDGSGTLPTYSTLIIRRNANGELVKLYDGYNIHFSEVID